MDDLQYFELAAHLVELPEESLDDMDYDALDELLMGKYDMQFEQFCNLVRDLLPMVTVAKSPLTGECFKGFGKDGMWYLKQALERSAE